MLCFRFITSFDVEERQIGLRQGILGAKGLGQESLPDRGVHVALPVKAHGQGQLGIKELRRFSQDGSKLAQRRRVIPHAVIEHGFVVAFLERHNVFDTKGYGMIHGASQRGTPEHMHIKLISTDFDGTLHAEHEEPPVPEDLQRLIAELQTDGAAWIINTGRDLSGLLEAVGRARLRVQPDFVVVVERAIYRHAGPAYVPVEPWNGRCDRLHRDLFARIAPDLPDLNAWVRSRHQAMIYEDDFSPFCVIASNNQEMDAIQTHLEGYCRSVPGLDVMRNDVYSRFNHAEFNKGTALAEVARILGVTPEQTVAAGDHWNDLPMLSRTVAHGLIAPSNAIEAVKLAVERQAGYVSGQPWGHGVARGLERLLG